MRRAGDMTAQMMVLGIVVEQPGAMVDIQRRLTDLFSAAAFAPNAAHSSLPTLVEQGYVRIVERPDPAWHRYEATDAGLTKLRAWVRSAPPRPAIREAIHGKVEFASLDELAEIIVMVQAEARVFQIASDRTREQLLAKSGKRVVTYRSSKGWEQELNEELTSVRLGDEVLMWSDIAERRRKLGRRLELIHQQFTDLARDSHV